MNGEVMGQKKFIRNFSAGNKQKIGIISAMLHHPQLLILDEPFNFLDPSSLMYMADEAINNDIKAEDFYKWFEIFADKYNPDCAYAQYCSTGSVKKEKVEGRISVMSKDFRDYFKLNDNNNEVEETEMEESDESSEQVTESKTPLTDDFMDDLDNELPFC